MVDFLNGVTHGEVVNSKGIAWWRHEKETLSVLLGLCQWDNQLLTPCNTFQYILTTKVSQNVAFFKTTCPNILIYVPLTLRLMSSDAKWRYKSGSKLTQVMAFCPTAPCHCLNQFLLIIKIVLWHSPESNFTKRALKLLNMWWGIWLLKSPWKHFADNELRGTGGHWDHYREDIQSLACRRMVNFQHIEIQTKWTTFCLDVAPRFNVLTGEYRRRNVINYLISGDKV